MIKMKAAEIAKIMGGSFHGQDLDIDGVFHFDSRQITPGSVFIALKGERQDGHDFVQSAMANGAALSIVSRSVSGAHIIVPDVLDGIAKLSSNLRNRLSKLKIVAITGSQGKTTTKDMLNSILTSQGQCVAPIGSYNNDIGVPITLLKCNDQTRFCILEMGARHLGDIARLTEIAVPDVGVVLKVGTAHLGEFGSRAKIAETKGELIRGLRPGATAVLGTYDEFTPKMNSNSAVKTITFGESGSCLIRAADLELHGGFPAFDLVTPEGRERVELQLLGVHQVPNALAAAGAAFALGISTADIAAALSTHQNASKWRMELTDLDGLTLINDSYNANPESMSAALRTLSLITQERGGNSWAFVGKMHELGSESEALHRKIGQLAGELGIDHLVVIGERSYISDEISADTSIHFYPDQNAASELLERFDSGDVVLVKASRAEHLEVIAEQIVTSWNERMGAGS
ncbi:MAG: UDP-N-acetylmuramoyl-tripeptide--D-alanyl-D-alanine ligase [Actinomycetota bacterium]